VKKTEAFIITTLTITGILFTLYRTPFTIYMGLLYTLVLYTTRENLKDRKIKPDPQTITGIILILTAPIFLTIKIGEYTSPSTTHALILAGLSLILFKINGSKTSLTILAIEAFTAIIAKTQGFKTLVTNLSNTFVDITSHLVQELIKLLSNTPITMKDNTAIVRNSIVIIGSGCSGLDAFILYLLAASILILLRKSNKKEASLLIIGSLGIIPLNAIRIYTLLLIGYHSGISFLELFHSHLGDLMFILYVFAYWRWALKRSKN